MISQKIKDLPLQKSPKNVGTLGEALKSCQKVQQIAQFGHTGCLI